MQCSTTFGTSARTSSVFRPIGSGAESISAQRPRTPRDYTAASETEEANTTARERNSPGLEYIDGTEDLPGDPPDPDDGDDGNDGDPPDDPPIDEPPTNPHQNENERFLQVMSDLAAGICTLCQPPSALRPEKVKVQEPDNFDSCNPCKLRDFLVSCNLHF